MIFEHVISFHLLLEFMTYKHIPKVTRNFVFLYDSCVDREF